MEYEQLPTNPRFINLTGRSFGEWTVLGHIGLKGPSRHWQCICSCGTEKSVSGASLSSGKSTSCGCVKARFEDLSGSIFGYLTVVRHVGSNDNGHRQWLCRCRCGIEKVLQEGNFIYGSTKSCGCQKASLISEASITHGQRNHDLYKTWYNMINRCTNPDNKEWHNYGGRNPPITVCERWLSVENFIDDMIERPFPGAILDRVENDKGYYSDNIKWSTPHESMRNTRRNIMITYDGKTLCAADWADMNGIPRGVVYKRIHEGWDSINAITTPHF